MIYMIDFDFPVGPCFCIIGNLLNMFACFNFDD